MNIRSRSAVVSAGIVVGIGVLVTGLFISASASGDPGAAPESTIAVTPSTSDIPKSELPANINPSKTPVYDPPSTGAEPPPSDEQAQAETQQYIERHADHPWLIPVGATAVLILLLVNLTLINWYAGQEQKCVVAPCPHCGKPLAGISAQIALATDNCGYCGKKVFESADG